MVFEFQEVFPLHLKEIPLDRDINFYIEIELVTLLISIHPHRMALVELREHKTQLSELLDRGFIQPSASPRSA